MIYEWKTGTMYKVPAHIAAQEMDKLAAENNLTASALVEASRPETAPLHNEFEWNDNVAAEEWRKQQARVMIASVVFKEESVPQKEPIRAYMHIERTTPFYEPIKAIIEDEQKTEKLFQVAMKELTAFRAKYNGLKEFQKLFMEIGRLEQVSIAETRAPLHPLQIHTRMVAAGV